MIERAVRGFDAVETWVFDLDNTLYPHHLNLWRQVDERIRAYIVGFLRVTHEEAFRVQKDYYRRYGTTLRGLMEEHGLDPDKFLEVVHEIDHSPLTPDPALGAAIAKLPGRKLVLTNGTRRHAEAVMRRLEIEQHFDDVFDIAAAELEPKPRPQVYDRFLARHSVDPTKPAIFEDLARNLEVPHALGMTTVLVVPVGTPKFFARSGNSPAATHPTSITSPTTSPAVCVVSPMRAAAATRVAAFFRNSRQVRQFKRQG
jgi:putative hydrolase of the HAD superfamily